MTTSVSDQLANLLCRRDNVGALAIGHSLAVLYARQNDDEKRHRVSNERNFRGFTYGDADYGTQSYLYFEQTGQVATVIREYWQGSTAKGRTRIGKYIGQLEAALEADAAFKKAITELVSVQVESDA